MAEPFDLAEELAKQPHLLEMPGNLLMKGGPEDYIGAVLCVRGTLYFREAHTPLVREALCHQERIQKGKVKHAAHPSAAPRETRWQL